MVTLGIEVTPQGPAMIEALITIQSTRDEYCGVFSGTILHSPNLRFLSHLGEAPFKNESAGYGSAPPDGRINILAEVDQGEPPALREKQRVMTLYLIRTNGDPAFLRWEQGPLEPRIGVTDQKWGNAHKPEGGFTYQDWNG